MNPPHFAPHSHRRCTRILALAASLLVLVLANAGQVEGRGTGALSPLPGQQDPADVNSASDVFTLYVETGGEQHTYPISLSDFDSTSIEGPDLGSLDLGVAQRYRVLDLDHLEIVDRSFTWVGDETLKVDGQEVPCRVIAVSDSFGHSRRWIAKDSFETLIKEAGVDQDGPFTVVLTRYPQSAAE